MNLIFAFFLFLATTYPPLTNQQLSEFQQAMTTAIEQSKQQLSDLWQSIGSSKTVLTAADKIKVDTLSTMIATKEILAGKFMQADSIRSPAVREAVLNILHKEEISEADLLNLQSIVDREKAQIKAYDSAKH